MAIDRTRATPLYQQLKSILQQQIDSGGLQPGDMLPSLRQLCKQYKVSTITVRRALQELTAEGRLQGQQGIGTFVTARNQHPRLALVILGFDDKEWRRNSTIFGDLVAGAATIAWEQEALFSVSKAGSGQSTADVLASILDERFFDGLLIRILPDIAPQDLEPVLSARMPYVVIKRHIPGLPINCAIVDDAEAAARATAHLIVRGRRRIAFICPLTTTIGRERAEGYRRALAAHGLPYAPELACPTADWFTESGQAAARQVLAQPEPPDAVFAAGDMLAIGVYRAAADLGLRIPEDLAVVGYDDIEAAAALQPPLTTVRTSYYDFGARATELLLDLIAGRATPPQQILLDSPLVIRASCGP